VAPTDPSCPLEDQTHRRVPPPEKWKPTPTDPSTSCRKPETLTPTALASHHIFPLRHRRVHRQSQILTSNPDGPLPVLVAGDLRVTSAPIVQSHLDQWYLRYFYMDLTFEKSWSDPLEIKGIQLNTYDFLLIKKIYSVLCTNVFVLFLIKKNEK
jgi:hypothetical protein